MVPPFPSRRVITHSRRAPGRCVLAQHAVSAVDEVALVDLARIVCRLPAPCPFIGAQLDVVAVTVIAPVPAIVADEERSGVLPGVG